MNRRIFTSSIVVFALILASCSSTENRESHTIDNQELDIIQKNEIKDNINIPINDFLLSQTQNISRITSIERIIHTATEELKSDIIYNYDSNDRLFSIFETASEPNEDYYDAFTYFYYTENGSFLGWNDIVRQSGVSSVKNTPAPDMLITGIVNFADNSCFQQIVQQGKKLNSWQNRLENSISSIRSDNFNNGNTIFGESHLDFSRGQLYYYGIPFIVGSNEEGNLSIESINVQDNDRIELQFSFGSKEFSLLQRSDSVNQIVSEVVDISNGSIVTIRTSTVSEDGNQIIESTNFPGRDISITERIERENKPSNFHFIHF